MSNSLLKWYRELGCFGCCPPYLATVRLRHKWHVTKEYKRKCDYRSYEAVSQSCVGRQEAKSDQRTGEVQQGSEDVGVALARLDAFASDTDADPPSSAIGATARDVICLVGMELGRSELRPSWLPAWTGDTWDRLDQRLEDA